MGNETKRITHLLYNKKKLDKYFCAINVVNRPKIGYNRINLRCSITLVSFEPTFTLNGIPISPIGCQAPLREKTSGEGKRLVAVTHLALLGVKRQEPTFWAIQRIKRELETTLFVFAPTFQWMPRTFYILYERALAGWNT